MKSSISILLLSAAVALAESPETIQRVPLDERVVVTVPVATNRVSATPALTNDVPAFSPESNDSPKP